MRLFIFVILFFIENNNRCLSLYYKMNTCHINGKPHHCMPPFVNIIENIKPTLSSDGEPLTNAKLNKHVDFLTDEHSIHNVTCWNSRSLQSNSINFTFSLGKRFRIYYISVLPCYNNTPNAIGFYKSLDFGKTWIPWQFYSNNCQKTFNMREETITKPNNSTIIDVLTKIKCFRLESLKFSKEPVMTFSLPWHSTYNQIRNQILNDWMIATDVKIVLMRNESPKMHDKSSFSIGDVSIGGRCMCNGHASSCSVGHSLNNGRQLKCDCRHNTEGQDCQYCGRGYLDLPWQRATVRNPFVCRKCNCNLHSSNCQFSQDLYNKRAGMSGGICVNCLHNTAGSNCHYCQDGYYRDWTKPLDHKLVCRKCLCNPIGAISRNKCNKRTGQCLCKEGVTGEVCNRCMKGYTQTRSITKPCSKINIQMEASKQKPCPPCHAKRSRIRFKKFCRKDAVFVATLQSQEIIEDKIRFDLLIDQEWHYKRRKRILRNFPHYWSPNSPTNSYNHYPNMESNQKLVIPIWMYLKDVMCSCEKIQLGGTYLFLARLLKLNPYVKPVHQKRSKRQIFKQMEMMLKLSRSVLLKWSSSWQRKLRKFKGFEKNGYCKRFFGKNRRKYRKKMKKQRNYSKYKYYNDRSNGRQ